MARKAQFDVLKVNRLFTVRENIGSVGFAAATDGSNKTKVTLTPKDEAGKALVGPRKLEIYLSDDATGVGLTGTAASGNVVDGGDGVDLSDLTAKKHKIVQTAATGAYQLSITDTGKTQYYVCVVDPISGMPFVAGRILTANYG
ncbi:MAG TPA: hypothetical protein VI229_00390 [Burkholderiales bacterium]